MPAFSYYLLDYAKCFSLDPDLPEPIRVAATNRLLESLLAVRAPHPVEAILAGLGLNLDPTADREARP